MSTPYVLPVCVLMPLVASLSGCAPAQPSQTADPVAIVLALFDRLNAGDLDSFMSLYADNAVVSDPMGRLEGAEAIRQHYQESLSRSWRYEVSDIKVDGNVVTYTSKVYSSANALLHTDRGLNVIADGKIIFDGTAEIYRLECDSDSSQAFCVAK